MADLVAQTAKPKPRPGTNPIQSAADRLRMAGRLGGLRADTGADMQEGVQIQGAFRKRGPVKGRKGDQRFI